MGGKGGALQTRVERSRVRRISPALRVAQALARTAAGIESWAFDDTTAEQARAVIEAVGLVRRASRLLWEAFEGS